MQKKEKELVVRDDKVKEVLLSVLPQNAPKRIKLNTVLMLVKVLQR